MYYFRTGKTEIDEQIDAFIEFVKHFLQIEVISIYLLGSYIDDSAVKSSDIDIAIIHNSSDPQKIKKISAFFTRFSRELFKREVDLYLISREQIEELDEAQLLTREGIINVKISSELLYGDDLRDSVQVPSFEAYLKPTIETPFHFITKARGLSWSPDQMSSLTYPNESDYYFGYLAQSAETHRTIESKPVLTLIGWIATSLIALKAQKMVGKKSDVARMYELYLHDQWSPYVAKSYELIRTTLSYQIPQLEHDRKSLRAICERLLEFERYYVTEYRTYKDGLQNQTR